MLGGVAINIVGFFTLRLFKSKNKILEKFHNFLIKNSFTPEGKIS